jgi:hypothetical protein
MLSGTRKQVKESRTNRCSCPSSIAMPNMRLNAFKQVKSMANNFLSHRKVKKLHDIWSKIAKLTEISRFVTEARNRAVAQKIVFDLAKNASHYIKMQKTSKNRTRFGRKLEKSFKISKNLDIFQVQTWNIDSHWNLMSRHKSRHMRQEFEV